MKFLFITYVFLIFQKQTKIKRVSFRRLGCTWHEARKQRIAGWCVFFHIMPLQVLNLQVARTMFPQREIFIPTVMIKKDIAVKALQQLTSKCKWKPISITLFWPQIVLKFDWAFHVLYEVVMQ